MSETSPLNDLIFVFEWQVHLLVVSLFAVLGVWWGITRRPWYFAPTLFLGLLWLFVPLEAPEPAVALLVATPILAATCRSIRWFAEPAVKSHAVDSSAKVSPWRWRISDALWLTFVASLFCGLVVKLRQLPWARFGEILDRPTVYWPEIVLNAACLVTVAMVLLVVVYQRTWRRQILACVILGLALAAAIALQQTFVRKEWLMITDWSVQVVNLQGTGWAWTQSPDARDILQLYTLSFLEFTTILLVGLLAILWPIVPAYPKWRVALRGVSSCGLVAILIGLGVIYVEILNRPAWPAEEWPVENGRDELISIMAQHEAINPKSLSLDELRSSTNEAAAAKIELLCRELNELLCSKDITLFDSRSDKSDFQHVKGMLDRSHEARNFARTLGAQTKADWAAGRRQDALERIMICLRLGAAMQRCCTASEALVGVAIEGIAMHYLSDFRTELTCAESAQLMPLFEQIAASRESQDLLLARDRVYMEEAYGWRLRLSEAGRRLLKVPSDFEKPWRVVCGRRDARIALLQTDLAIRCYLERTGEVPRTLGDLTPNGVSTLPLDPYSQQPLIYWPCGDEFVLYSIGEDGDDDSGRLGNIIQFFKTDQLDLDLDAWTRGMN